MHQDFPNAHSAIVKLPHRVLPSLWILQGRFVDKTKKYMFISLYLGFALCIFLGFVLFNDVLVFKEGENVLRVAVDAMGGDHAPAEIVKGVVSAVNKMENLEVLLVGSRDSIKKSVGNKINDPRIRIINTQEVIAGDEDPGLAIRSKRNSSMMTAMHLVCHGKADAVISAGNTAPSWAADCF